MKKQIIFSILSLLFSTISFATDNFVILSTELEPYAKLDDVIAVSNKLSDYLPVDTPIQKPLKILSYGKSTWDEFMDVYTNNAIIYCRASRETNPSSGTQTRFAFMAYVSDETNPTEVEFQYYKSTGSHTQSQQMDQIFIYTLNKTNGWNVTTRNVTSKINSTNGITSSYKSNTLTFELDLENIPKSSTTNFGFVQVGTNIIVEDGVINVPTADANTGTKGATYLIADSFGTTAEDGRVGYATTEYAARQFIKKSVFPYPIFQTTNTYNIGDRIQYKFSIYECLEDNVSGSWSIVSNKFKVIEPIQTQINEINSNVSFISNSLDTISNSLDNTISNVSSISNSVDAITDKVDSLDSEEWTFTLDDGSQVEKHVGISSNSWPETCYLFWNTNYVASKQPATSTLYIPTNFPTKRLYLVVDDTDQAKVIVGTKNSITDFDRNVVIDVIPVRTADSGTMTNRDFRLNVGGTQIGACATSSSWRAFHIEYDAVTKTWFCESRTLALRQYYSANGEKTYCPSENVPATVEEWIALQTTQQEPVTSQPLLGGGFTPPVSPTLDEPSEEEPSVDDEEESAEEEVEEESIDEEEPPEDEPEEEPVDEEPEENIDEGE